MRKKQIHRYVLVDVWNSACVEKKQSLKKNGALGYKKNKNNLSFFFYKSIFFHSAPRRVDMNFPRRLRKITTPIVPKINTIMITIATGTPTLTPGLPTSAVGGNIDGGSSSMLETPPYSVVPLATIEKSGSISIDFRFRLRIKSNGNLKLKIRADINQQIINHLFVCVTYHSISL